MWKPLYIYIYNFFGTNVVESLLSFSVMCVCCCMLILLKGKGEKIIFLIIF